VTAGAERGAPWPTMVDEAMQFAQFRPAFLARRVTTAPGVIAYRALRPANRVRCLLVRTDVSIDIGLHVPVWNGLRITQPTLNIADTPTGRYVVLEQVIPGTEAVCEAVLDSLCAALEKMPSGGQPVPVLVRELGIWACFFEKYGHEGLSPAARQGLFGELWVLGRILAPLVGTDRAVGAWIGPFGAEHDFQHGVAAVEVKATTSRGTVRISSENQLDDVGLEALCLVVLDLRTLSAGGITLPALVAETRARVLEATGSSAEFDRRLVQAGYLEAHAPLYEDGWAVRATDVYAVQGAFPRISRMNVPSPISRVQYTLALDACVGHLLSIDELGATVATHWTSLTSSDS
jgi:hypothetical protein